MIVAIIGSLLAALGFGIIFNIHGKHLVTAVAGGIIGYVVYELLQLQKVPVTTSLFLASMVFSVYAEVAARKFKIPVTVYLVVSLIILVPGKGMYYTMLEVVQGDPVQALWVGLDTVAQAGALAMGTVIVSTITRFIFARRAKNKLPR